MSYFIANEESKIVIYGYSVNGKAMAKNLNYSGNVIAFFDRNAKQHEELSDIKMLSPEEGVNYFSDQLNELIIIISIANIFEHRSIALQLQKDGFKKILFFPDYSFDQKAAEIKQMKAVFKKILDGGIFNEDKMLLFSSLKLHLNTLILETTSKSVTALIPIELIHIGDKQTFLENSQNSFTFSNELEKLPYYFDTPLSGFNYYLDLYDFFEGNNESGSNSYFKWKRAMNRGKQLSDYDKNRVLNDRRSVYKNMRDALAVNDNFFLLNPIELKFKDDGYFYLVDGANRTCFYLHNGLRLIPAKLNISCYNRWADKGRLNAREKQRLLTNILLIKYSINLHPELYTSAPSPSFIQYLNYLKICRFLSENAINLENSKVLVINSTNSYFSLFFNRIKAKTTSYVLNEKFKEYNTLINKLCLSEKINIVSGNLDEIAKKDKYDVIFYLDKDDSIWDSLTNQSAFIKKSSANLVFWTYKSDERIDMIEKDFKDYYNERINVYCSESHQYNCVYAFNKKKI
jgi:hypothetical protein